MPIDAHLALDGVRYRFPGDPAETVAGVDWAIPRGAIHCLLGRSGCGKTTLLKLAAGLLAPDAGTVRIDGTPVSGPRLSVGFVFQAPTLLAWLSALDNVLLPVSLKRRPQPSDREAAR
ncbi:nitrate ABC transporter ATP-binding protein, partial [Methylobacterium frigidaeris]